MSLFRSWGFGAELNFKGEKAVEGMTRAQRSAVALHRSFEGLRDAGSRITGGLQTIGTLLAPLGIGFGFAGAKASQLAGDLEAQTMTMRILLGDMEKTNRLMGLIEQHALDAPFTQGELVEGSKRLLRLTGDNVDRNFDLLQVMETMAALNPTKTLTDAIEGLLDATSGGGFERLKEFGLAFKAEDFEAAGRPGGEAWATAVTDAIRAKMLELTRGEDLVGALAATMGGRLSTLQDAVENLLRGIGASLNSILKPAVVGLSALINDNADEVVAAFDRMLAGWQGKWDSIGQPTLDALLAAWESLGTTGRGWILGAGAALVGLVTALVPVGGAAGVAAVGLGGVVMIASAAIPIVTALTGIVGALEVALAGLTLPVAVGLLGALVVMAGTLGWAVVTVGAGVAAVAAAGVAAVAMFRELADRSATLTNILPVFADQALGGVATWLDRVRVAAGAFSTEFLAVLGPVVTEVLGTMQPAFEELVLAVLDLLQELGMVGPTAGDAASVGGVLGQIMGGIVAPAVRNVGHGLATMIDLMRIVVPLVEVMLRSFRRLSTAIFGIADGSLTARDAVHLMLLTIVQNLLITVRSIVAVVLGIMERTITKIASVARTIPGLEGFVDFVVGDFQGVKSAALQQLDDTIARIDRQAADIEGKRAAATSPVVNVPEQPVQVEAKVTSKVVVDGNELGRAEGAAAVRSGERGTGPSLPSQQRGRVLRRGLEVTPLRVAEAF